MLETNQPPPRPASDVLDVPATSASGSVTTAATLTNVLLLLLIVSIGAVATYARFFYEPRVNPEYAQQLSGAIGERLQANAPKIEQEVVDLSQEAWPIVKSALVERARSDYPLYARALEKEGTEYFNNVEQAFVAKVKARYHDYLMRHRDILKAEFPEHATRENVERILAAFEATFDELVERYYIDQFRHEADRTQELWAAIPPAREPESDEPPLEKQLGDTTREWVVSLLRAPPVPPPPPAGFSSAAPTADTEAPTTVDHTSEARPARSAALQRTEVPQ